MVMKMVMMMTMIMKMMMMTMIKMMVVMLMMMMTMVKRCEWAVGSEDAHQWPECDQTASCFLVINWMMMPMPMPLVVMMMPLVVKMMMMVGIWQRKIMNLIELIMGMRRKINVMMTRMRATTRMMMSTTMMMTRTGMMTRTRMPGSGSPSLGRAHPDNCFLLNLNSSKTNSIISVIKNQQYYQYYQKTTVLSKPPVLSYPTPRIVCS